MYKTEQEVDQLIEEMVKRTKGNYITQGVSFNKTCPKSLGLLKQVLMEFPTFGGGMKQMLIERYQKNIQNKKSTVTQKKERDDLYIPIPDVIDEIEEFNDTDINNGETKKDFSSWGL